jgi:hypothetical protein
MEENIIAWNFENWVTVVIMVALGFAIIALIAQGVKSSRAAGVAEGAGGMSNTPMSG